jgi:beta-lactamase class A
VLTFAKVKLLTRIVVKLPCAAFHSIVLLVFATTLHLSAQAPDANELVQKIRAELSKNQGTFAVAFKDATTGEQLLINDREHFHAASTMKTPVMIEVFRQAAAHTFNLSDSIVIKNSFTSIVDGSPYQLSPDDDSFSALYQAVGKKRTLYYVMYQMIIFSSNLSTNLIIEKVDARKVTHTMRTLGAMDIEVLRGVEDTKAFEKGLNNTVTAFDLLILYDQIARGKIISTSACDQMTNILLDQQFNEIIPAQLPKEVRVAHKTGSIRGVQHDSGIVILPDGKKYSLVILSKNLADEPAAIQSMATVSKMIYDYIEQK